jgi:glycine/D-amino acid oxidase-like deaminating enzyme
VAVAAAADAELAEPSAWSPLPRARPGRLQRAAEVSGYLRGYAALSAAPVTESAQVLSVRRSGGYRVVTTAGTWTAASVVLATG